MENKRVKKIGTFTFGFCLIVIGIAAFISMFIGIEVLRYTLYAWPLIIILIGAEILYYNSKEDVVLKYDILGSILLGTVFVISIFGSIASHALAEFIQNKDYYINSLKNINEVHYIECVDVENKLN